MAIPFEFSRGEAHDLLKGGLSNQWKCEAVQLNFSEVGGNMTSVSSQIPKDRGKIILVVDDDRDSITAYVDFLDEFGCEFVTACDGQEALKAYRTNRGKVILVITDNSMPQMTGREFVTELRKEGETVPIIMISGDSEAEFRRWTSSAGLSAFISKPISFDRLISAVRDALTLH